MVSVVLLHDLDPLDGHLVLNSVVLGGVHREFSYFLEGEDTETPVDVELKLLLDLVAALLEDRLAHGPGVVGDLRLKLDCVLVHTGHILRVEVNGEVVGVELLLLALGTGTTGWLLGEHVCDS